MIEINQEHYPYNRAWIHSESAESIIRRLFDLLPHGSGIDYKWTIDQYKTIKNRFACYNSYHAMDEHGFYCHVYGFSVVYDYNPDTGTFQFVRFSFRGQKEHSCCGFGLVDYLQDILYELVF